MSEHTGELEDRKPDIERECGCQDCAAYIDNWTVGSNLTQVFQLPGPSGGAWRGLQGLQGGVLAGSGGPATGPGAYDAPMLHLVEATEVYRDGKCLPPDCDIVENCRIKISFRFVAYVAVGDPADAPSITGITMPASYQPPPMGITTGWTNPGSPPSGQGQPRVTTYGNNSSADATNQPYSATIDYQLQYDGSCGHLDKYNLQNMTAQMFWKGQSYNVSFSLGENAGYHQLWLGCKPCSPKEEPQI